MWIEANANTQRLKLGWMEDPVEFSDNGTAQVKKEVGKRLVEEVPGIEEVDSE